MSTRFSKAQMMGRRGELLAELFLQDLEPAFVAQPTTPDFGVDLLVGFTNPKGGLNTYGVQVKATEQLVRPSFPVQKRLYDVLANSNIPALLLVADVKLNELYYAWLRPDEHGRRSESHSVMIPLTHIDDAVKEDLRRQLAG